MIGVSMTNLTYKGYECHVELAESQDKLVGKVLGLKNSLLLCEGTSVRALTKDFKETIDEYLLECEKRGWSPEKPYSGTFNVRIGSEVHKRLAIEAESEGISMNKLIKKLLSERYAIS